MGDERVLLGLSGGVDFSVCAALFSRAEGDRLTSIHIDHGFMRKGETEEICRVFSKRRLHFVYVDARERFLNRLKGIIDPESKRKLIGEKFARTFENEARRHGNPEFLAQGTIYPDVVEFGANKSAVIKSHHNVGSLPEKLGFMGVVEPLRGLFKDEVRTVGRMLGLSAKLVNRQPFPDPGLAIRIIGEMTQEKAGDPVRGRRHRPGRDRAQQPCRSVFCSAYGHPKRRRGGRFPLLFLRLAIRAVRTRDFMTCEYALLLHGFLGSITNDVRGVNRVACDITDKPPVTITRHSSRRLSPPIGF